MAKNYLFKINTPIGINIRTTENYWVYAVLEATTNPRIKPFTRDEWAKHFSREEIKRWYKFRRSEFQHAEKP